jgi:hypothetical protein
MAMNRLGYTLTVLGLPEHMPGWAKDLTVATQKVMDDQYLHGPGGLDNFYGQADAWLETQATLRGSDRTWPAAGNPPFQMVIPRRQMVTFNADETMSSAFLPTDPAIQMPTLDPLPPVNPTGPTGPFGPTGNTPLPTQTDQQMGALMAEMMKIEQLLRTALAAVGK